MQYRTDLAMERAEGLETIPGVYMRTTGEDGFSRVEVAVRTPEAAQRLQKPCGRYITYETAPLHTLPQERRQALAGALAQDLRAMLPAEGGVLVVGLGNRRITSDALGSRVAEGILVTRHLQDAVPEPLRGRLRAVSALAPGVLGVTGIETADLVRGVVERARPAAVVAVDALSARACQRIGTAIQVTDTGILPGSGVGNHRAGLTRQTLGVPVIAVGVPTVVYSAVIVRDALDALLRDLPECGGESGAAAEALSGRMTRLALGELVVTPREIDQLVGELGQTLAMSINRALQPRLTEAEIAAFMNETV